MVVHIVMWKLKQNAEGTNREENALIMKEKLESLNGKINSIKKIEVGININKSDTAYDVVLNTEFDNIEDLNEYQKHPEHLKVGEFVGKVSEKRAVVDYEI